MSVARSSVSVVSTAESPFPPHPILGCVERLVAQLDEVVQVDPLFMPTGEKRAALLGVEQVARRLAALRMSLVSVAEDVADQDGMRTPAAWLTAHTGTTRAEAARAAHQGDLVRKRWQATGAALAAGRISTEQARIIVDALESLEEGAGKPVTAPMKLAVEELLLGEAPGSTLAELRRAGDRALEVLDPVTYAKQEAKKVDAEEERATRAARASFTDLHDGSVRFTATIPKAVAARLKKYLHAHTSPRTRNDHPDLVAGDVGEATRLPWNRRMGAAFCAWLERIDPDSMPLTGGSPTTLVVTIALADLLSDLGVAVTGDGTTISAREARRLACNASIIPAVLGGPSQDLDLGRARRLFTGRQKLLLAHGHPTCRAEGCDVPADFCEAHHLGTPWHAGGTTDLGHGILLCPWHHHRTHHPDYTHTRLPNGDLRYHRRT